MAITKVTTPDLINLTFNDNTDGVILPKGITSNISASVSNCDYPTTGTALYQLDTNTNDTCGSNNGTNNNVTFNTSIKKYGTASAEFNGTNADIDLPAGINGTTMSVSFWIYIDATVSSDQVVFELQGTGGGSAGQDGYGVFFTAGGGGKLYMQTLNSNSNHTRSNVAIPASQWVHVAAVWNAGSRTFYIDTVAQTTGGTQTTYLTMNANTIGSRGSGEFFDGYIDQARIFSSALTQAQVTELYNETTVADNTGRPASPVDGEFRYNTTDKKVEYYDGSNWYQLSSSTAVPQSGTTGACNYPTTATNLFQFNDNVTDTCGNNNGTAVNAAYATGNFGKAYDFSANSTSYSGTSAFVTFSDDMSKQNDFSWSFWLKSTGTISNYATIISFYGSYYNYIYFNPGISNIYMSLGDGADTSFNTGMTSGSSWYHLALTKSSSTGRVFYVNGSSVFSDGTTANGGAAPRTGNAIGMHWNSSSTWQYPLNGDTLIDQFRIFPSGLTATQVGYLYTETAP